MIIGNVLVRAPLINVFTVTSDAITKNDSVSEDSD